MAGDTIQGRRDAAVIAATVEECARFIQDPCGDSIEDAIRAGLANDLRKHMAGVPKPEDACAYQPSCREILCELVEMVKRLEPPVHLLNLTDGKVGHGHSFTSSPGGE